MPRMALSQEESDSAAVITIQLIISLIVMPVTPVLWLCGAGNQTSLVQRLARMSPTAWCVFFALTMPGAVSHVWQLFYRAFIPSNLLDTAILTLTSALLALLVVAGSYYIARFLRWGKPPVPAAPTAESTDSRQAVNGLDKAEADQVQLEQGEQKETGQPEEPTARSSGSSWKKQILDVVFVLAEACAVELGWRVYLLPRLLYTVPPLTALLSMALLSTLSSIPSVLYVVCSDSPIIIRHVNKASPSDRRLFYREPPSLSTTVAYTLHLYLFNVGLGVLTMAAGFCVWPSVCVSLYWNHIAFIVSGRMLISTYLPIGMETLALASMENKKCQRLAWIRGTAWKVSCEGVAGTIATLPVVYLAFEYVRGGWQESAINDLLPGLST